MVPLSIEGSSIATILTFSDNLVLNLVLIGALVVLLMLSAFFSSSETAYSTVNLIRLKSYQDEKRRGAKKAVYIAEKYDLTIITILIGNNLVNIGATTIAGTIVASLIINQTFADLVTTIAMTLLVLIFGEILPKTLAKQKAEDLALKFSGPMYFVIKLFSPLSWFFLKLRKGLIKTDDKDSEPYMTEDELENVIDVMEDQGVLDEKDAELISNSISINEKTVYEIMTPRVDMISIDIEDSVTEIKNTFFEYQFSRIPVYREDKDNVIGILRERDFFTALIKHGPDKININKLISKPFFVSKATKVSDLIREMQKEKKHFAIVVDEYGGTDGIVTLEDALEELVGEIYDEYDEVEAVPEIKKVDDNRYLISSDMELEEVFEQLELGPTPECIYSNIAGFVYDLCEDVPEEGMSVQIDSTYEINDIENPILKKYKLTFTIKKVVDKRIKLVELLVTEIVDEDENNEEE